MNDDFEYSIAKVNNSAALSGDMEYDYPFTNEYKSIVDEVLSNMKQPSAKTKRNVEFIRDCMPSLDEIKIIVADIIEYYENFFSLNTSNSKPKPKIRFFLHTKPKSMGYGDADLSSIRIFLLAFPDALRSKRYSPDDKNDLKGIYNVDEKEWFENYLRHALAHALFHVFHRNHYAIPDQVPNNVLMEVFAEYFATSYICYYISSHYQSEEYNRKRNSIFDFIDFSSEIKYFGIGRKQYLGKFCNPDEIAADKDKYNALLSNGEKSIEITQNSSVSSADYAGGYFLYRAAEVKNKGLVGTKHPDYVNAYNNMKVGKGDEALYDLIKLKEALKGEVWFEN